MKILIFIIMFFLIGAFFIISENSLALKKQEARHEFSKLYSFWLGKIFENSKQVSGYIIRLDWLPEKK